MSNLRIVKEPGYIYDLFFMFVLNFNKDYCLVNYINYNKSNEDTEFYNKVVSDYSPFSNDLLPFFYLKENGKCFMTEYYFDKIKKDLTSIFDFSVIQDAISDHQQLVQNLIEFYFPDADTQIKNNWSTSILSIGRLIKCSQYNDTVKSSLFSFFIEPYPIIQKLSNELIQKEYLLARNYERNHKKIVAVQNDLDFQSLSDNIKNIKHSQINLNDFSDVYISVCFVNKNCLRTLYIEDKALLILGCDYIDLIDYLLNQNKQPSLYEFGNAISEKNRIDILELILRKDEITIKDIEQELKFTGTNAYYHLSLMINANLIKTRNQGRTVLYSLNRGYFDIISGMIIKFSNKSKKK